MYAPDRAVVATPIGAVVVEGDAEFVTRITIGPAMFTRVGDTAAVREAADQLTAYFVRRLRSFDLPLAPAATPRGEVLRRAMIGIGYGQTASYGELANRIGSSARALGQACARNPFPIVVPCHRVLQTGGRLGPYSAGDGPVTKQWLLVHEGVGLL